VKNVILLLTISLALLLSSPALAGTLEVPLAPVTQGPKPPQPGETIALDLAGAFEMALQRNLNLQVGRYRLAAADVGITKSAGFFDPALELSSTASQTESPAATDLEGAQIVSSRSAQFKADLMQRLPTGTAFSLSSTFRRSESNSARNFFNPYWSGDLSFGFQQPLLDGFGTVVNRSNIIIAYNSREQTLTGFELDVIKTLQDVETAYWNLIAARKVVEVREQSLELALRLLDETNERVKVGTSAPIDLVQSEATVADRRRALIYARNSAANAEDTLKAALGFDQPAEWMASIATSESFETDPITADLNQAIETALESRPEIRQQLLAIENREHSVKIARNAVMPNLDLSASYGYSGVGGNQLALIPETGQVVVVAPGGSRDAADQITNMDFPHWSVGLTMTMPLGNHDAKASLAQARYQLQQSKVELNALQQQITWEVRRAVRGLDDGVAAVDAAIAASEMSRRNVEAEQTKFDNGLSTNYQVLQIQEDLDAALLSELQARIDYRLAILGMRINTGTYLEAFGIEIADPEDPDEPHGWWGKVEWLKFVDIDQAINR
jgi:outer membrane protein TolC